MLLYETMSISYHSYSLYMATAGHVSPQSTLILLLEYGTDQFKNIKIRNEMVTNDKSLNNS